MTPRVLVTGAAGFLAGHLIEALRGAGTALVTGVDERPIPAGLTDLAETVDLFVTDDVDRVVKSSRPDEVYHLVGAVRGDDAAVTRSNVETTRLLLDAVRRNAPRASVVLVGSAAEYGAVPLAEQPVAESWKGTPAFAYGRAKQQVTALGQSAAHAGLHVVIARPFNVVGAGVPATLVAGALVQRLRDALAGPPPRSVAVGVTTSVRDFVDALDVGRGLVMIARHGIPGETYNLCTGRGHRVADVVGHLVALAGGGIRVDAVDSLSRPGEVTALVGSPAKAAALGWRSMRSLEESLHAAWVASAPAGTA